MYPSEPRIHLIYYRSIGYRGFLMEYEMLEKPQVASPNQWYIYLLSAILALIVGSGLILVFVKYKKRAAKVKELCQQAR